MLSGWAVLLVFQLLGEALAQVLALPVPGPVVGMVLLMAALELRLPETEGLVAVSSGLLGHLSLLFVPAGVGIILHASTLAEEWPAVLTALAVSTVASIAVTGWIADRLSRPHEGAR